MIAKIFPLRPRAHGAAPTVQYILGLSQHKNDDEAERCEYLTDNGLALADLAMLSNSNQSNDFLSIISDEAIQSLNYQSRRNTTARKPIWHSMISLPAEDTHKLNKCDWQTIAHRFMDGMGFNNCRWLAALHQDTNNTHIHIVANTIQDSPGNPVVSRRNDYRKAENIMREFEYDFDLSKTPNPGEGKNLNDKSRQPRKQLIRDLIDETLIETSKLPNPDLLHFVKNLDRYGVSTYVQWQKEKPKGLSFELDQFRVSGTKLGGRGRYSLKGLQNKGITVPTGERLNRLEMLTGPDRTPTETPDKETRNTLDSQTALSSKKVTIEIKISKQQSEALKQSGLIREPSEIVQTRRSSIWKYRVSLRDIKTYDEKSLKHLVEQLLHAILRLVEQLLNLLGFSVSLTSQNGSWIREDHYGDSIGLHLNGQDITRIVDERLDRRYHLDSEKKLGAGPGWLPSDP